MELQEQIRHFLLQEIELYGDGPALSSMPKVTPPQVEAVTETLELNVDSLAELEQQMQSCQRCGLGALRHKLVFGYGNPNADIMLVGEAPGQHEDETGLPFAGEAGALLDKVLAAIKLNREQIYLCNMVKCRPPNNRDPEPAEIKTCLLYLHKQIQLVKPRFILCLGRYAAQMLLDRTDSLSQLRGKVHQAMGASVIVTYHPAALLRYPNYKRDTWADVQLLRRLYDEYIAKSDGS
jgi:uracil-DNA glycosylase